MNEVRPAVTMRPTQLSRKTCVALGMLIVPGALCVLPGAAQEPAPSQVTVRTIRDDTVRGQVVAFSFEDGLTLRVGESGRRVIELRDLVRISAGQGMGAPRARDGVLRLVGGDFLYGRLAETEEGAVTLETPGLGSVPVPLDRIVAWEPPAFRLGRGAARLDAGLAVASPLVGDELDEDVVLLNNGDVARGFVTAIDEAGVTLERDTEQAVISTDLVVAVRLVEPAPVRVDGPYVVVQLARSGRLTVTDLNWSGKSIRVQPSFGPPRRIDADRVVRVDVFGGRWERLSARTPINESQTPMLALTWPYRVNENVRGGAMLVGGERFDSGLGVHSRSSLTFALDDETQEFVTWFGMDDDSGPLADVDVLIRVDGSPRFESKHVRRGTLHGPVRIDVRRAKELELIVDFGENGDLQDRFNWIEPALIRGERK